MFLPIAKTGSPSVATAESEGFLPTSNVSLSVTAAALDRGLPTSLDGLSVATDVLLNALPTAFASLSEVVAVSDGFLPKPIDKDSATLKVSAKVFAIRDMKSPIIAVATNRFDAIADLSLLLRTAAVSFPSDIKQSPRGARSVLPQKRFLLLNQRCKLPQSRPHSFQHPH